MMEFVNRKDDIYSYEMEVLKLMFETANQWFLIIVNHDKPSLPHIKCLKPPTSLSYEPSRIAAPKGR